MVKRDILRCANLQTQIACPVVPFDDGFTVNLFNYRSISSPSTAVAVVSSKFVWVCFAIKTLMFLVISVPDSAKGISFFTVPLMMLAIMVEVLFVMQGAVSFSLSIPFITMTLMVLTIIFYTLLFMCLVPTLIPRLHPFRILMSICTNALTVFFWIGVILSFFLSVCTRFALYMKVASTCGAKLAYRLDFMAMFAAFCFDLLLNSICLTLCYPFFSPFSSAFPAFSTQAASTWLHLKGIFLLLCIAFSTPFHDNPHNSFEQIIAHGAGGVK